MKCSQCGAEATLKGCEYCGSAQSITVDKDAPPAHFVATEVWRCKNCDRLVTGKNPHLWCIDNGEERKIHDLEKVEVHMAAKCHLCNEWRNPSEVFCGNRHGKIDAYVVTAEGKWIKHTPNPKPKPAPATQSIPEPEKKFGCGCLSAIGPIFFYVVIFLIAGAIFAPPIWMNIQEKQAREAENIRIMSLRPWDNNPGMSQMVFDDLSKDRQDFYWQYTGGSESSWVVNKEYYSMKDNSNTRAEIRIEVKPSRPGDFKGISLHSTWVRNGDTWSLVKDSTFLLYTP